MPSRQYLQDWEKEGMTELELFLAENEFHCVPSTTVVVEEADLPPEQWIESDEVIVEVVPGSAPLNWTGFVFYSDVHSCTPVGDSQQSTNARLVDFVFCDQPECGGPGGWLGWWSNDPAHNPSHPDNPLLPYK